MYQPEDPNLRRETPVGAGYEPDYARASEPVPVTPVAPVAAVTPVVPVRAAYVAPVGTYNYRLVQAVTFVVAVICALVAIRFVMKFMGASLSSPFVGFMYGVTDPMVAPFQGIFPTTANGFAVIEPASLVAITIYALLGWGLSRLIRIATAPRTSRARIE